MLQLHFLPSDDLVQRELLVQKYRKAVRKGTVIEIQGVFFFVFVFFLLLTNRSVLKILMTESKTVLKNKYQRTLKVYLNDII